MVKFCYNVVMQLKRKNILRIWRYGWMIVGLVLIIFVLSKGIITSRSVTYQLDFRETIGPDITGWYPEKRTHFEGDSLQLLAEPIYMKVYSPIDFEHLSLDGQMYPVDKNIRLGLKQKDGSWQYQNIDSEYFSLNFDLSEALVRRNQLEFILSVPDMATSTISLKNNWRLILAR